jgi:hypothetical protein
MTAEITIFDNVHGDIKSLPSDMQASVIKELAQQVHDNPKLSNKFITFLQTNLDPVMAVYGYYYSIDEGLLQPTARNFQTTMLFEQEFKYLIKHLANDSKRENLYKSVEEGTDLTKIEIELTSLFNIQPEDEIGTGTWEQPELELPEDVISQSIPRTQQEIDELRDDFVKNAKETLSDLIFTDKIDADKLIDRLINKLDDQTAYDMLVAHYAEYVPELEEIHNNATHPLVAVMQQSTIDVVKAAFNKVKGVTSITTDADE